MTDIATSTTTATLLVAGTTIGSWESAATAVLGLPRDDVRQLPQWPSALGPDQRLVGFVDSPVRALGVGLPAGRDADPAPLLDAWCASAQQALRLLQRHPGQCLLLDVDELLLHPRAGQAACSAHLGVAAEITVAQVLPAQHDAVRLALAHLTVAQHRRARLMAEELVAASTPLGPTQGASTVAVPAPDLAGAMARLVELEAAAARAPSQAARLESLQKQQTEAARDRDAARIELAVKQRDEASALAQLHQTQAELESVLKRLSSLDAELLGARSVAQQAQTLSQARLEVAEEAGREAEAARREAETARKEAEVAGREAEAARREAETARKEAEAARQAAELRQVQADALLAALRGELEVHRAAAEETAARAQRESVEREAAEREAQSRASSQLAELRKAAESERHLLLVQLHQVQEELERYYFENERLASTVAEPLAAAIRVHRLVPGQVRDDAPHRELNLSLQGVQLPRGDWAEIPVRLLDHHGHAGLAIFATDEQRPPLSAWAGSGREGDRPFMLLVPSDANTRAAFDTLSASDWRLVQAVAAHLANHVAERRAVLAPRWAATAARLQLELATLPERWRHDDVQVRNAAEAGHVAIELDNVGLPGRVTDHLSVLWTPGRHGGDGGGLQLALPEGALPPLTAWPMGEDGCAATTWDLLPAGASSSERVRIWRRIPRADRAWLQTMLDALPGLIGSSTEHKGFVAQAQALAAFARRAAHGPRWRRIARRLLGRTDR